MDSLINAGFAKYFLKNFKTLPIVCLFVFASGSKDFSASLNLVKSLSQAIGDPNKLIEVKFN